MKLVNSKGKPVTMTEILEIVNSNPDYCLDDSIKGVKVIRTVKLNKFVAEFREVKNGK